MDDVISRQGAINLLKKWSDGYKYIETETELAIKEFQHLLSAQLEIIRCKDCIYGHLYIDVQNGVTDSWIECRNPEGLYRDVSVDGYCSASIRRT